MGKRCMPKADGQPTSEVSCRKRCSRAAAKRHRLIAICAIGAAASVAAAVLGVVRAFVIVDNAARELFLRRSIERAWPLIIFAGLLAAAALWIAAWFDEGK